MNSRRGLARSAPRRALENGEELLDRQMTPDASGFRQRQLIDPGLNFGGGTSPVKTDHTIHRVDVGRVAKWEADGYLALSILVDPPTDGRTYGWRGTGWVPISGVGPLAGVQWDEAGITWDETGVNWDAAQGLAGSVRGNGTARGPVALGESPTDGRGYVRVGLNQTWVPAFTEAQADARYAPISTVSFAEPPTDGQAYARRGWDRSWVAVATGNGVPEAPPTGGCFTRCGADETWQPAFTQVDADARYARLGQVAGVVYDAPHDTTAYARSAGAWVRALTQAVADTLYAPLSAGGLTQAGADARYAAISVADQVAALASRVSALEQR